MTRVAVFGATGYGGIELVRILLAHPEVEIGYVGGHTTVGENLADFYPHLAGAIDLTVGKIDVAAVAEGVDVMFFALPHAVGAALVAEALALGKQVIDFSADCRLKNLADYERYYEPHPHPELLEQAVYGLPELHREEITGTRLAAVPGCYPTGAILALAPACAEGLIEPDGLIVDSKSGVSGAGRSLSLTTHFTECNESVAAYKVAQHRHTPEMVQELSLLGAPVTLTFTLTGSNFCDIGLAIDADAGRLIAVSAIDNLVKGLSGAAVQCMNLMLGVPEETALTTYAVWP